MDLAANLFLLNFSLAGQNELISAAVVEAFSPGAILFEEGDPADGVLLVLQGEVAIERSAEGQTQVLGVFPAGAYLGEVAVLDGQGRSTRARAQGAAQVARLPTEVVLRVLASEPPELTLSLFRNVLAQLRRTNDLFLHEVVQKEKLSLIGGMASSLMHDLRNPVSGITLSADLIEMFHHDSDTKQACQVIRLQCDRLVAMARELLEFSRGETRLQIDATTTTALLERFREMSPSYFERPGLTIDLESDGAEIRIDSLRLLRVLQNLVSNAAEALAPRHQAAIAIDGRVVAGIFQLTVADNGPGIPEAIRARLFDPFVTHGKSGGTGLGTAIVKSIVEAHGGTISFQSSPEEGTTFFIALPATFTEASAPDA